MLFHLAYEPLTLGDPDGHNDVTNVLNFFLHYVNKILHFGGL